MNSASTASFDYDEGGLFTRADLGADSLVVSRDPESGRITDTALGGVIDSYTYNTFGEPETYTASFGPTALYAVAYVRDALGRIAEKTETIQSQATTYEYTYDASGRLTDVEENTVSVAHYDYDANGNRIAGSFNDVSGSVTSAVYDGQDRLSSTPPRSAAPRRTRTARTASSRRRPTVLGPRRTPTMCLGACSASSCRTRR